MFSAVPPSAVQYLKAGENDGDTPIYKDGRVYHRISPYVLTQARAFGDRVGVPKDAPYSDVFDVALIRASAIVDSVSNVLGIPTDHMAPYKSIGDAIRDLKAELKNARDNAERLQDQVNRLTKVLNQERTNRSIAESRSENYKGDAENYKRDAEREREEKGVLLNDLKFFQSETDRLNAEVKDLKARIPKMSTAPEAVSNIVNAEPGSCIRLSPLQALKATEGEPSGPWKFVGWRTSVAILASHDYPGKTFVVRDGEWLDPTTRKWKRGSMFPVVEDYFDSRRDAENALASAVPPEGILEDTFVVENQAVSAIVNDVRLEGKTLHVSSCPGKVVVGFARGFDEVDVYIWNPTAGQGQYKRLTRSHVFVEGRRLASHEKKLLEFVCGWKF